MSTKLPFILGISIVLTGCGSNSEAIVDPDPTPDAAPIPACANITSLEVREGGRMILAAGPAHSHTASEGLELATADGTVWAYAGYDVADVETITVSGPDCETSVIEVAVLPLVWTTLSDWDRGEGPPGREYGGWWLSDETMRPGLHIFGGFHYRPRQFTPSSDLWFFDFATNEWSERPSAEAPIRPGGRIAPGPEPGTIIQHGGAALEPDGSLDTPPVLQMLNYADAEPTWSASPHAEGAPGSYTGAFIRDARRARWLSICGYDSRDLGLHCNVAEYSPETGWQDVEVAGERPQGRSGFHYAYDEESDRVLVVGGQVGRADLAIGGDTWALDLSETPARWVRLFEDSPLVRRRNGAFVLDPIGRRLILWGGTPDGRTAQQGLSILRIDPGHERWDHIPMPVEITARSSGFAVYDAANQRALMGFGNSRAVYTDLYALSL